MFWCRILIIGALALLPLDATAEDEVKERCGPYDGVDLTDDPELLESILSAHKEWLADSEWREDDPRRANLCRADLEMADLQRANLTKAYLRSVNLTKANLESANLTRADLTKADLEAANLTEADLTKADLEAADLTEAILTEANLTKADLGAADLTRANLGAVILTEANLMFANLTEANLTMANLTEANLEVVNLTKAKLWSANLTKAKLLRTDITNAIVTDAKFWGAQYEPSSAPSKGYLSGIEGLRGVWFDKGDQGGLVLLRAALKEVGLRELEREATYAIEHGKTNYAPWHERWLKRLLFEYPSGYGLHPGRPLWIIAVLVFLCAAIYTIPIYKTTGARIVRAWPIHRTVNEHEIVAVEGEEEIERLSANKILAAVGYAFYFSLLSAFHIGWRELNVGNWLTRIQPRRYLLRAEGWVRTVSGVQSLLSVYLLGLSVLTYFGRPFE